MNVTEAMQGPATNLQTYNTGLADMDTSKKAKRRSLLPQFSRKESYEERDRAGIEEEDEAPKSSSRPSSEYKRQSTESATRRVVDEDRRMMPPPTSKLTRPVSMIPPRGSSQISKTSRRSQAADSTKDKDTDAEAARAQSLAALTGAASEPAPTSPSKIVMPEPGLARSGSTRLPQSPRVGGPVIPSRTTSHRAMHDGHSRAMSSLQGSTSNIAEKRSSVARLQTLTPLDQSADISSQMSPQRSSRMRPVSHMPPQQTSPPRASVMSRGRPGSQMLPPSSKPSFNTYQQHYSPVKSTLPKPPLPAPKQSKLASAIEDDVAATFDTAKQQIELLQLSLLHQASDQCMQDYIASAKRKLGRQHTKLRKDYESIRATELVHQRAANLSALESWCPDPGMLVENLQILSLVYSDLSSLTEEGSRYGDVVSMFELWVDEAEAPQPGSFTQPLPEEWKTAHASLALKLRSIQRNLGVLPPPRESGDGEMSGLESVLRGCKTLVDGMLKELEFMTKLEKEILARERTKIEDEVKALVLDDVGMQPAAQWVPVWQKAA